MKTTSFPSGATVTTFPLPPATFRPLTAHDQALAEFGLPPRPVGVPALLEKWTLHMTHSQRFVEPTFRLMPGKRHGPRHRQGTEGSDNWSGAVVFAPAGRTFATIGGRWPVPTPHLATPGQTNYSSFWIGIDGDGSGDVFQAGVECEIGDSGPNLYAWWEWFPEAEVKIENFPVAAGDVLSCLLTVASNTSGNVLLTNVTRNTSTSFRITAPAGTALVGNSAEWIAERPGVDGSLSKLADFGSMSFTGCDAFTQMGITGTLAKVTLGDRSPVSPSLASLGGRLYLAWKGDGNNFLNVMCSTDGGRTFGHKHTSGERSPQAPGLVAHGANLFIAWKGDGNDNLNVARVATAGDAITGLVDKVTLGDTSPVGPSLGSANGRLYLSWKGDGNNFLNVMCSTDGGHSFGHKHTSPERSPQAPGLVAHGGNLFIAWKGDGNDNLNVARVATAGDAITGLVDKLTLGDTSPVSPSLGSLGGRLFLGWKGDGNDFLNVMISDDNGRTFHDKLTSPERSPTGPALCAHNGGMFIGWRGDGNTLLNVAMVGFGDGSRQLRPLSSGDDIDMTDGGQTISDGTIALPDTVQCRFVGSELVSKVTLGDRSPVSPSLASLGGRLYLAWKGDGNNFLNVMCSTDGGRSFGHKHTSGERSPQTPGLTAHGGNLFIAWKGDGNDNLNVARVATAGDAITGLVDKVTLGDTSPVGPSLASVNGRLYLSWKGDGNNFLNVMCSTDGGRSFGHKHTSGERSPRAPGLGALGANLMITWKGDGNDNLNVARVATAGDAITGLVDKAILGDTSPVSPTLASIAARLFLGWKGDGNNFLNVMFSDDTGRTFKDKLTSPERSSDGPALCAHGGSLFIAWKGDGNNLLNVAQVRLT
jgi:peptidase A4-like protein